MLNLENLERRWFKYKVNSYTSHTIIALSLIVIISLLLYLDFGKKQNTESTKISSEKPIITVQKSKEEKVVLKEKTVQEIKLNKDEENKKIVLSPSLGFIKTISDKAPKYYKEEPKVKEKVVEVKEVITEVVKQKEVTQENIVSNINISRQDTQKDIQEVINRFKKSNSPALSLFIAKKYYELGDFNKAYNYALLTNGINNNIEESWIIFAKSLVKLDKKAKAIETLTEYINHSNSQRAKMLLDNIKSGKLK